MHAGCACMQDVHACRMCLHMPVSRWSCDASHETPVDPETTDKSHPRAIPCKRITPVKSHLTDEAQQLGGWGLEKGHHVYSHKPGEPCTAQAHPRTAAGLTSYVRQSRKVGEGTSSCGSPTYDRTTPRAMVDLPAKATMRCICCMACKGNHEMHMLHGCTCRLWDNCS